MKKMTKGAIVTGLGVALLLGGGGTLAVWNADQGSTAGTVVAGDLQLTSTGGTWTSNLSGTIADIGSYKVVPGETLTYTQDLGITLAGDMMVAGLTVTGATADNGFGADVTVSDPALENAAGAILAATELTPADSGAATATTTFTYSESASAESMNATMDFSAINYVLTQKAPAPLAG